MIEPFFSDSFSLTRSDSLLHVWTMLFSCFWFHGPFDACFWMIEKTQSCNYSDNGGFA